MFDSFFTELYFIKHCKIRKNLNLSQIILFLNKVNFGVDLIRLLLNNSTAEEDVAAVEGGCLAGGDGGEGVV